MLEKYHYKMLVNKVLLVVILMLTFQLLLVTTDRRDNSGNRSSSTSETVGIPAPPESHVRPNLENYGDLPLKFLCMRKHTKYVGRSIILHNEDKIACVLAGQCVSYNANDPLKMNGV